MNKTVWKLAPYQYFEVKAIEGWLDEQSQKGLQFRTRFGPVCTFERKISPARYRIDLRRSGDERTDDERLAAYEELGWVYCSDYTQYAEVFRAEDPRTVELHTDGELLQSLVRRGCRERLWLCLLYIGLLINTVAETAELLRSLGGFFRAVAAPSSLLVLIAVAAFVLFLLLQMMGIGLSIIRLHRSGYTAHSIHTPQRAKRCTVSQALQIMLLLMFVSGMIASLLSMLM